MSGKIIRMLTLTAFMVIITAVVGASQAEARAGGGSSMGSRGSRSYSQPSRSYSQPAPSRPAAPAYQPSPMGQPQSGGFLRSMAGGMVGGMLGGMLFRGLGFGGGGGMGGMGGGGGIGLFEIILLAGIGYLIYRFVKKRREEEPVNSYRDISPVSYAPTYPAIAAGADPVDDLDQGIARLRQMDPSFNEERFCDNAMDIFFKIQGAWMNRDLAPVSGLLADEMKRLTTALEEFTGEMTDENPDSRR